MYLVDAAGAQGSGPASRPPGRGAQHPVGLAKLRDGAADVGEADAKVSGTAALVSDAGALSAFRVWLRSERGVEQLEDWDLFTIDIDALTVISVDNGQLLVDRWSTTEGRQTMRRA
jgi:hypothetical protein